jgi:hypothetical protein
MPGALRVKTDELPAVSLLLARGAGVAFRDLIRRDAAVRAAFDAADLAPVGPEVAAVVGRECFDPLLRKFAEDVGGTILPRPDADLDRLAACLEPALRDFLQTRCTPGGDLHAALADPLAPAPAGFPDNRLPADPAQPAGRRSADVLALAPTVHDADGLDEVKRKLIAFATTDPWLLEEHTGYVFDHTPTVMFVEPDPVRVFQATDDFLHRATRLAGKTPIELFLERQPDIPERQRQRLLRWDRDNFLGVFHVRGIERPFLLTDELTGGGEYRLLVTREAALDSMRRGLLFTSRVIPWDDLWVISGAQEVLGTVDGPGLAEARRRLHSTPGGRRRHPDDPKVKEAFAVQAEQHRAWVDLFGGDEIGFRDGQALQDAFARFYRHWGQELRDPKTGMTRAEQCERRHNRPAPDVPKAMLSEGLLDAHDVGVLSDPYHGMIILTGYSLFRTALESQAAPTRAQLGVVLDYLRDSSVDYAVFLRARERHPQRLEQLLRLALRDESFSLDRDFDALLRKYKGQMMRKPRLPDVTLADDA